MAPPSAPQGGFGPLGGHAVGIRVSQGAQQQFNDCISTLAAKYHVAVAYQPANRFWTFQAIETALFVVLRARAGRCLRVVGPPPAELMARGVTRGAP